MGSGLHWSGHCWPSLSNSYALLYSQGRELCPFGENCLGRRIQGNVSTYFAGRREIGVKFLMRSAAGDPKSTPHASDYFVYDGSLDSKKKWVTTGSYSFRADDHSLPHFSADYRRCLPESVPRQNVPKQICLNKCAQTKCA